MRGSVYDPYPEAERLARLEAIEQAAIAYRDAVVAAKAALIANHSILPVMERVSKCERALFATLEQ